MGQLVLGHRSEQESWDLALGKNQSGLVQLSYEGITVEAVLERRLKEDAYGPEATTVAALDCIEKALLLMNSQRLAEDFGRRATQLLVSTEDTADSAEVYSATQKLVHYYRGTPEGVPEWLGHFVQTGYRHYCAILPQAFLDRGVKPESLSSMLRFVFTLESLALSFGCRRSELEIAIMHAGEADDPVKVSMLWSAENVLRMRGIPEMREHFEHVLANELLLPSLPDSLSGFLLSLNFAPAISAFTVELLSKAFAVLPDQVLMPWLPKLFRTLRNFGSAALPVLLKEASGIFPRNLRDLEDWQPAWETPPRGVQDSPEPSRTRSPRAGAALALLHRHPPAAQTLSALLGLDPAFQEPAPEPSSNPGSTGTTSKPRALLQKYPATQESLVKNKTW
jgi:hypothetical protein